MIFRFNKAQLGRPMEQALNGLLVGLQETSKEEIEVIADEFPYKLIIRAGKAETKIVWDPELPGYKYVGVPLPATKEWHRPDQAKVDHRTLEVDLPGPAQAPEQPAQEIPVTVDSVVSMFMGLGKEERTRFFVEVWRSIGEEKT